MAIKINTALTHNDGSPILTGSIILNRTEFLTKIVPDGEVFKEQHEVKFMLDLYRSQELIEAGSDPIAGWVNNFRRVYRKILTQQQYSEVFVSANSGVLVMGWLKGLIDADLGASTSEIIPLFE